VKTKLIYDKALKINHPLSAQQSPGFLVLTIGLIICLTLLINVPSKIILLHGMMFSMHSILCPIIALLYLIVLRTSTLQEQRHFLNIALMTLYIFCIGVYLLINLPAAKYMHNNPVYQIIFDEIPKKFFAVTLAFALSFYLPHLLFCNKAHSLAPKQCMFLALLGGFSFFFLSFFLVFSGNYMYQLKQLVFDSMLIASLLLLLDGVFYWAFLLKYWHARSRVVREKECVPLCYYLICLAIVVMLTCSACEYRIITFGEDGVLAASALFFPITLAISTLAGELWGYRTNLKLSLALMVTQVLFDTLLMGIVALPSPEFSSLNPLYNYLMLRRLPATFLTLFATFLSNAMLLHYLKQRKVPRSLRILIANICANSLLCLIDYSLLFGGIYPYDQIISLVANVWQYKLVMSLLLLPLLLKICFVLEQKNSSLSNTLAA
jgi:uncharacterized PurR-regulated membrane protein YhhQ (DUF165 family)